MRLVDIDTSTTDGQRLIEVLVSEALAGVSHLSPGAYLANPDTWERFVGLAMEAMYTGQTLTATLNALVRGELVQEAVDEEFRDYEEQLAAKVRPALLRRMVTTD
jgi:hypothetical protein